MMDNRQRPITKAHLGELKNNNFAEFKFHLFITYLLILCNEGAELVVVT